MVVSSLMLGAVMLVVGLVQLAPGAEAAQYATVLIGTGCALLTIGALLAQLRALWIRRRKASQKENTHQRSVSSIDMLLAQHRYIFFLIMEILNKFDVYKLFNSAKYIDFIFQLIK